MLHQYDFKKWSKSSTINARYMLVELTNNMKLPKQAFWIPCSLVQLHILCNLPLLQGHEHTAQQKTSEQLSFNKTQAIIVPCNTKVDAKSHCLLHCHPRNRTIVQQKKRKRKIWIFIALNDFLHYTLAWTCVWVFYYTIFSPFYM